VAERSIYCIKVEKEVEYREFISASFRHISISGFRVRASRASFVAFLQSLAPDIASLDLKFRRNRPNRGRDIVIFRFFPDGGRPPSWICNARVWTTHERHLDIFITVQNLVGIDTV